MGCSVESDEGVGDDVVQVTSGGEDESLARVEDQVDARLEGLRPSRQVSRHFFVGQSAEDDAQMVLADDTLQQATTLWTNGVD